MTANTASRNEHREAAPYRTHSMREPPLTVPALPSAVSTLVRGPLPAERWLTLAAHFRARCRTPASGDPLYDWMVVNAAIEQMFPFPRKRLKE
jgi:hypothetical protein